MSDDVTLGQRQKAICAAIKEGLPAIQACEPLGQQLSPEGLSRAAIKLPAVYVACAGMDRDDRTLNIGIPVAVHCRTVVWTAFLVVSDLVDPTTSTDLLEGLADLVTSDGFGGLEFGGPVLQRAENLYKGELGKTPLCIYTVRFAHAI